MSFFAFLATRKDYLLIADENQTQTFSFCFSLATSLDESV